jgi:hypothetical protein
MRSAAQCIKGHVEDIGKPFSRNGLSLPLIPYLNGYSNILRVVSAFRPRGVPGPTSKLSLRVPARMGRRETKHKGGRNSKGKPRPSCCPAPRADALAVGGYKRSRGREREGALHVGPFSHATTFSYESPGPSCYRRKERAQVYNGGV